MMTTINMAKRYQTTPSKILKIENDYLAYILDETALYLEQAATDKEGNIKLNKLKWTDREKRRKQKAKKQGNQKLIDFIQRNHR